MTATPPRPHGGRRAQAVLPASAPAAAPEGMERFIPSASAGGR